MSVTCCCCLDTIVNEFVYKNNNHYYTKINYLLKYTFNIHVNIEDIINCRVEEGGVCKKCYERMEQACIFKNQTEEAFLRLSSVTIKAETIDQETYDDIPASPLSIDNDTYALLVVERNKPVSKSEYFSRPIKNLKQQTKTRLPKKNTKRGKSENKSKIVETKREEKIIDEKTCHICLGSFESNEKLRNHYKESHFKNFVCDICGDTFSARVELTKHKRAQHAAKVECPQCKKFLKRDTLTQHMKRHNKALIYMCNMCPERFMYYHGRLQHMEQAHGITKPVYTCQYCNKEFHMRNKLNSHIKNMHIRERKHTCQVCFKAFIRPECLKNHMLYHQGIRKHQCKICLKSYFRLSTLKEHMKIHLNIKNHVCHICNQAFTQKCTLKGHLKTHGIDVPKIDSPNF